MRFRLHRAWGLPSRPHKRSPPGSRRNPTARRCPRSQSSSQPGRASAPPRPTGSKLRPCSSSTRSGPWRPDTSRRRTRHTSQLRREERWIQRRKVRARSLPASTRCRRDMRGTELGTGGPSRCQRSQPHMAFGRRRPPRRSRQRGRARKRCHPRCFGMSRRCTAHTWSCLHWAPRCRQRKAWAALHPASTSCLTGKRYSRPARPAPWRR